MAVEDFAVGIGLGIVGGLVMGLAMLSSSESVYNSPQEVYTCAVSEWNSSQLECDVHIVKDEKILIDKDSPLARQIIDKK